MLDHKHSGSFLVHISLGPLNNMVTLYNKVTFVNIS